MQNTTTEARCSSCLMPAEVTAEGVAAAHDYPYAASNYGQCKGSGKPALAGPSTPPAVWGANFGTFVEIGVLPSPMPQVQRNEWTVTITGVRFTHAGRCWKCRECVYVATEGGVIQLGFDHKGKGFEKERAGSAPSYDGPCPNGSCDNRVVFGGQSWDKPSAMPLSEGRTVQYREWEQLRRDLGVITPDMTPADLKRLRRTR
ncbi:hypothetical protein ACGF3G_00570 [Streptomyces sp. NPDC048179]|uniref:hypothetical protein n=1 Tax=Streptomyces sp. NPDC048179 TaxID=3365506 RepID=UPI0037128F32